MPDPVGSFEPRSFGRRDRGAGGPDGKKRSRPEMAPQRLEKIESAPGNGMGSEASNPQHLGLRPAAADRARWPRAAGMGKSCKGYVTIKPSRHFVRPIWIGRRLGDTQKQVSQFPCPSLRPRTRVAGSNPRAAVRPSGLLAPRMLWLLDCFVARAPRNDGWVAADPIDSVVIGRRLRVCARTRQAGVARATATWTFVSGVLPNCHM